MFHSLSLQVVEIWHENDVILTSFCAIEPVTLQAVIYSSVLCGRQTCMIFISLPAFFQDLIRKRNNMARKNIPFEGYKAKDHVRYRELTLEEQKEALVKAKTMMNEVRVDVKLYCELTLWVYIMAGVGYCWQRNALFLALMNGWLYHFCVIQFEKIGYCATKRRKQAQDTV